MPASWFVDGAYAFKAWQSLNCPDRLDFVKLRQFLETTYLNISGNERIEDAYYFNADPEPPTAGQNAFHNVLTKGPGLRVKLYGIMHLTKLR